MKSKVNIKKAAAMQLLELVNRNGKTFKGVVSEGILRAEVDLKDNSGSYQFDFRSAKGLKSATEILLSENDSFRATAIRLSLGVRNKNLPSIYVPQTYPNKTIFVDEATGLQSDHLEAIYNGVLSYDKGNTKYIDGMSLREARMVGDSQQTNTSNKSSSWAGDGTVELARGLSIQGSNIGSFKIDVPSPENLKLQYSTAPNVDLKVVLILELIGAKAVGGNELLSSQTV